MSTVAEYYSLIPGEYGPIKQLEFTQELGPEGEVNQVLRIALFRSPDLAGSTISIRFSGVRDFEFHQSCWSLAAFGLLEITEVDGGFLVSEEEGQIRFFCSSFVILES